MTRGVWAVVMLIVASCRSEGFAVDGGRLRSMGEAADRLKGIAERHAQAGDDLSPASPEVAASLSVLCRPDEAEALSSLPSERYREVTRYTRHVTSVMDVYSEAGDRAPSQQHITDNVRALSACYDTVLWSIRATLTTADKLVAETPDLLGSPKAVSSLAKLRTNMAVVLDGALETFTLPGIGPSWCERRLRPLLATTMAAAATMSRQDKERLRDSVRAAERCGVDLQALHRALAS